MIRLDKTLTIALLLLLPVALLATDKPDMTKQKTWGKKEKDEFYEWLKTQQGNAPTGDESHQVVKPTQTIEALQKEMEKKDKEKDKPASEGPSKQVTVKRILIKNVVAHFHLLVGPVLKVEVPTIELKDVSSDGAAGAAAQLTSEIFEAVLAAILKNAKGIVPTDFLEGLDKEFLELGGEALEQAKEVAKEVGKVLNVDYLVETSVQKVDSQIIINVKITDTNNERQIWEQEYNEEWKDVLRLESNLSLSIAENLNTTITDPEIKTIRFETKGTGFINHHFGKSVPKSASLRKVIG